MPVFLLAFSSKAQFQMGTQASYLKGHGKNDNPSSLTGVTVFVRYALTDRFVVGSVAHVYSPRKSHYSDGTVSYTAIDDVTNVSSSFDILLASKNSFIQPYIGADAGVSLSNHQVEYTNDMKQATKNMIRQTYILFSPKVGLNMAIAGSFGMFTQLQYNYSPGNGGRTKINVANGKESYELTTEPISKYFNFDGGLYYELGDLMKHFR